MEKLCIIPHHLGVASMYPQHTSKALEIVQDTSEYVLCPVIKPDVYEDMVQTTGFHRQGVRISDYPIKRYEFTACLLWYKPMSGLLLAMTLVMCVFHAKNTHIGPPKM